MRRACDRKRKCRRECCYLHILYYSEYIGWMALGLFERQFCCCETACRIHHNESGPSRKTIIWFMGFAFLLAFQIFLPIERTPSQSHLKLDGLCCPPWSMPLPVILFSPFAIQSESVCVNVCMRVWLDLFDCDCKLRGMDSLYFRI